MRIFKISGRFMQDGKWKTNGRNDFIGYFMMEEENEEFIGYMTELYIPQIMCLPKNEEELNSSPYNYFRYIKGLYMEKNNQLLFLKLSNDHLLDPLLYVFPNIDKNGFWSAQDPSCKDFFVGEPISPGIKRIAEESTIELSEITDNNEKKKIAAEIKQKYDEMLKCGLKNNMSLIKNLELYKKFLLIESTLVFDNEY